MMKEKGKMQSQHYFIWNGIDSRTMGVKVLAYPPPVRPKERVEYVTIPGISGDLAIKEGKDIYESYTRPMELRNCRGFSVDAVRKWLSGEGKMIYGCEPEYVYDVDLSAVQQYDYFVNGIWRCTLQMRTQPLKERLYTRPETLTEAGTIRNSGDVEAKPIILAYPAQNATSMNISVNGYTLTISNVTGAVLIDCDAQEATDPDRTVLLTNDTGGPFPVFQVGDNTVGGTGWSTLEIDKQERFR